MEARELVNRPCLNYKDYTYTGREDSPLGLGYCAEPEEIGTIRDGRNGKPWIVGKRNGVKVWCAVPALFDRPMLTEDEMATAQLGQVYRGTDHRDWVKTRDGQWVCIPGLLREMPSAEVDIPPETKKRGATRKKVAPPPAAAPEAAEAAGPSQAKPPAASQKPPAPPRKPATAAVAEAAPAGPAAPAAATPKSQKPPAPPKKPATAAVEEAAPAPAAAPAAAAEPAKKLNRHQIYLKYKMGLLAKEEPGGKGHYDAAQLAWKELGDREKDEWVAKAKQALGITY